MALCAFAFGLLGYFLGPMPARESYLLRITPAVRAGIPAGAQHRFIADWWATIASFASGLSGGAICCVLAYRKRVRVDQQHVHQEEPRKYFA
jgi:hypothetical protein